MSFITEINTDELHQIWKESGRVLGNFETHRLYRHDEVLDIFFLFTLIPVFFCET